MSNIVVLVPCYNESITIKKVVEDFKKILPEAAIYVYDNNSTDKTDEIAKEAGAIVRYEHKQGKGNVVKTMFEEIDADCYIMVDGDDTYPAEEAQKFVKEILENNIDMVIGDRISLNNFGKIKGTSHRFGNKLVRDLVNKSYHSDIKDVMTGYRAFSKKFVKSFHPISEGFEIETEMTIYALEKNMKTSNLIIEYRDRPQGSHSKLKTYSDGLKVLKMIRRLKKKNKNCKEE